MRYMSYAYCKYLFLLNSILEKPNQEKWNIRVSTLLVSIIADVAI